MDILRQLTGRFRRKPVDKPRPTTVSIYYNELDNEPYLYYKFTEWSLIHSGLHYSCSKEAKE